MCGLVCVFFFCSSAFSREEENEQEGVEVEVEDGEEEKIISSSTLSIRRKQVKKRETPFVGLRVSQPPLLSFSLLPLELQLGAFCSPRPF